MDILAEGTKRSASLSSVFRNGEGMCRKVCIGGMQVPMIAACLLCGATGALREE